MPTPTPPSEPADEPAPCWLHPHASVPAGEERCAEISLNALRHNTRRFKDLAGEAELMAVVKAEAYGHGAIECARTMVEAGATWAGTAFVSEALSLRAAGLDVPLLAWLHPVGTDFGAAIEAGVDLGVSGWELEPIIQAARETGQRARVHLKIDTGLGRNGCPVARWPDLVHDAAGAQREGHLEVVGLFSHFAVADEPERPETTEQLEAFQAACEVAREAGITAQVRHVANTPAVLTRPDAHCDMVRVGVGLYGLSPLTDQISADLGLKPAMRLTSRLASVKQVPAGQGVSYGFRWFSETATTLGLVPLGYADGIPRIAEGVSVTIDGVRYPQVGRIAMDQFVIDLGPDAQASEFLGSPVVVFGDPEYGEPAVEEWAQASGTINYEVVTRISARVPRMHVPEHRRAPGAETLAQKAAVASSAGPPHGHDSVLSLDSPTVERTQALAEALGKQLEAGDVLILTGELGAGKTTFTQGLGRGLGVREGITSPTFVLSRIHPPLGQGPALVHVDAYRLGSAAELEDLDLADSVEDSVTVVEWGRDRAEDLAESRLEIELDRPVGGSTALDDGPAPWEADDQDEAAAPRVLTLRGVGPRWDAAAMARLRTALEADGHQAGRPSSG